MAIDIQATGTLGIAFESVAGTYVAPTKFMPLRSESLKYQQDTYWRRVIRGLADNIGGVNGPSHIEGDIEIEVLDDVFPYFLYASRNTVAKTGASAPFTYTTTPFHGANPTSARTLSITVVRNGVVFGYTGCVVSSISMTVDNGVLVATMHIVGRDEATQSAPTPSWPTTTPFGHGVYTIGIPTGSTVLDIDTFTFQVNDNAVAEPRLSTTRAPQFVRFAQREVTLSVSRDFSSRTDYDAYKALTAQSVRILASKGANNSVQLTMPAAVKDDFTVGQLGSQGDLVRSDITYQATYDTATSKSYEFIVITAESIT